MIEEGEMRKDALTTALSADSTRSCRKQGRTRAKKRDGIYLPVSRLPEEAEELAMKNTHLRSKQKI